MDIPKSKKQRERGQRVRGLLEDIKELWKENGDVRIRRVIGSLGMEGVREERAVEYLDTLEDAGKIRRTGNKIVYTGSNGKQTKSRKSEEAMEREIFRGISEAMDGDTFRPIDVLNELGDETKNKLGHSEPSRLSSLGKKLKKMGFGEYKKRTSSGTEYVIDNERYRDGLRRLNQKHKRERNLM